MDLAWVAPAIGSPIIYAAVSVGDKLILSRIGIRLQSFYLYVGISQLVIAAFILAIEGTSPSPALAVVQAVSGGLLWGGGLVLMFWALQREEVSRVMPVWQTSPIFVAVLAVPFLGEQIIWRHWLAIVMVVAGAGAVSLNIGAGNGGTRAPLLRPTFFALIAGALIIAVAQLFLKRAADDLSVWHLMAYRGIGLALALALPNLRPQYISGLARFISAPRRAIAVFLTETIGPFLGNLMLLTAIAHGPVSLVSALLGTRPIFVLAMTLGLGLVARSLLNERTTRADVMLKAASTGAVVAGVFLIALD